MVRRIRQFYKALFARLNKSDYTFLSDYLTKTELEVFMTLPVFDRKHSVDIARHLHHQGAQLELVRAGLLHDIGKARCPELTIVKRSICVLLEALFPKYARNKATSKKGKLGRALYVHQNHPEIGAEVLEILGCTDERIIWLVRHHADKEAAKTDDELAAFMVIDDRM